MRFFSDKGIIAWGGVDAYFGPCGIAEFKESMDNVDYTLVVSISTLHIQVRYG